VGVDQDTGVVSIRHEAIPGLMPAMTMPFDIRGQEVLEDLRVGDRVQGRLRIEGGRSVLAGLEITQMGVAPPIGLDSATARPARALLRVGDPLPDFAMTTQEGCPLRLSDLRGRVVVLTFIYTRCPLPDYCPLTDRKFARLAALVRPAPGLSDRVRLLSISIDPEHDTPEVLARHAASKGAVPPLWTFAVATHAELGKIAGPLGLAYGPAADQVIHTLSTAIVAPDGTLARLESGNGWSPEDMFKTVAGRSRAGP
jgi:protein SCO1/2